MHKEASTEKMFHFESGRKAKNLKELEEGIRRMSYREFNHHVNTEKNDFANWVAHVLHDRGLADKLETTQSKEITLLKIHERLNPPRHRESGTALARDTKRIEKVSEEATQFIAKEFFYGMFLGILLGIIIVRIVAIL